MRRFVLSGLGLVSVRYMHASMGASVHTLMGRAAAALTIMLNEDASISNSIVSRRRGSSKCGE